MILYLKRYYYHSTFTWFWNQFSICHWTKQYINHTNTHYIIPDVCPKLSDTRPIAFGTIAPPIIPIIIRPEISLRNVGLWSNALKKMSEKILETVTKKNTNINSWYWTDHQRKSKRCHGKNNCQCIKFNGRNTNQENCTQKCTSCFGSEVQTNSLLSFRKCILIFLSASNKPAITGQQTGIRINPEFQSILMNGIA